MNKKLSWRSRTNRMFGRKSKTDKRRRRSESHIEEPTELYYANMFGKEAMSTYYYWNKEISSDLDNWNIETNNDPIGTVDRIRYHQGDKYD